MAAEAGEAGEAAAHNLGALQAQLQALQRENSALTKDLCLKENYIQLKEQQVRVMQKRLEELESAVAAWKDRCLQQLNAADRAPETDAAPEWTPWKPKAAPAAVDKSLRHARKLLDKLSAADRDKLQPLVDLLARGDAAPERWETRFQDVDEELSKVLLLYLLPALAGVVADRAADTELRCFSRTYSKQTMDFRIAYTAPEPDAALAAAAATPPLSPSSGTPAAAFGDSSAGKAESLAPAYLRTLSAVTSQSPPGTDNVLSLNTPSSAEDLAFTIEDDPKTNTNSSSTSDGPAAVTHLFDCVDCDKRNNSAVPHGPRELHPTKAMYISRPLAGSSVAPVEGSKAASRRYTLTPNRSTPTFAVESTRLQSMNALPSPSSVSAVNTPTTASSTFSSDMEGERRSGASSFIGGAGLSKDSKIKKIMGGMMDRLNRHKTQLAAANTSLEDDEAICDGCGRGPLTGSKWVCRTCRSMEHHEYELCEKCYGQGVHGKENEDALFERIEEILIHKCPRLENERELMKLLRVGICKANLKKFSFCLTWIADLLQCKQTKDLRARALEISQITPQVRSEFVRLLRELLQRYRRDIELISEWEPVPLAASMVASGSNGVIRDSLGMGDTGGSAVQLDTLRIWVKDASDTSQQTQQQ